MKFKSKHPDYYKKIKKVENVDDVPKENVELNNKNENSSFYLVGTYSNHIYLIDKRDNIPFDILLGHQNGINKIKY